MVGYFIIKISEIRLVLARTSLVNNNKTQKTYNTYQMFDIFYNNTNGDVFGETSLAKEGLDQN